MVHAPIGKGDLSKLDPDDPTKFLTALAPKPRLEIPCGQSRSKRMQPGSIVRVISLRGGALKGRANLLM